MFVSLKFFSFLTGKINLNIFSYSFRMLVQDVHDVHAHPVFSAEQPQGVSPARAIVYF